MTSIQMRADKFCKQFGIDIPILLAPMAGACPPALSISVANAGGMGACGCLLMGPDAIQSWASEVRTGTNGAFQLNLWIPDPAPTRDAAHEKNIRAFLENWGPEVDTSAADVTLLDFDAQCDAMLAAGPSVISSIMGVYPEEFVQRMKSRGIKWIATVTTVTEARAAIDAGADAVVAQGMEAGGHRGAFDPSYAERSMVGLFALIPAICDAVHIPVIATGGIADARGVAAAMMLGASAVQVGTGFLRSPQSEIADAWRERLAETAPEDTAVTRAFSGRPGRALATDYVRAANSPETPNPAPYPVQRALTGPMRADAAATGDIERMQAWAGQSAGLGEDCDASEKAQRLWAEAQKIMAGG
jgi:nitronate monooxygenase